MRSGYKCQFWYNLRLKKIQLIGISNYNYGGASHDGAGYSSVNLLTNKCAAQWEYYDNNVSLLKTPTLKWNLRLNTVFLETFTDNIVETFTDSASKVYEKETKMLNKTKH